MRMLAATSWRFGKSAGDLEPVMPVLSPHAHRVVVEPGFVAAGTFGYRARVTPPQMIATLITANATQ
jgi:hypothetical protein